jgi:hypothetical protein
MLENVSSQDNFKLFSAQSLTKIKPVKICDDYVVCDLGQIFAESSIALYGSDSVVKSFEGFSDMP